MSNLTIDFLRHILNEIEFLLNESAHYKLNDFINSKIHKRVFIRSLEIIGEAVKNLPKEVLIKYPEINFKEAARMRDHLIRGYFGIDYTIVWELITNDIPKLRKQIIFLIEDLEKNK